jgi:glycosyltransferase involved in cell wall biosynthesis
MAWRKGIYGRMLTRTADALLGFGGQARFFFQGLGAPSEKIVTMPNAVDHSRFSGNAPESDRSQTRKRFEIEGLCFLYLGQISKHKGLDNLLYAWKLFSKSNQAPATLLIIGDGDERVPLMRLAIEWGLSGVRFPGPVKYQELPEVYRAGDVFVFPTLGDLQGATVIEAMAAGLPVVCSNAAACAPELIEEGKTGWQIEPRDVNTLADLFKRITDQAFPIKDMGRQARAAVAGHTVDNMVQGFRRAVEISMTNPEKADSDERISRS